MSGHSHMARTQDVAAFAERLEDGYLMCRTWAHAWDRSSSSVRRSDGRVSWTVACSTCGTVRTRIMTTSGEIIGNRYTYPEGYQSAGMGRIGQSGLAVIRMESLKRLGGA